MPTSFETVPLAPPAAEHLRRQADSMGIPGLAIALAAPGRRALWVHGVDAPGSGRAVTPDTWFSVASTGKHFTALAVLALAQAGCIDLAAPIGSYLTDLPVAWAGRSVASLMRHTSGLPEYLAYAEVEVVPSRRDAFVRTYGHLAPAFGEGQGWIYTNTNYILLGFLVAQMAGASYAQALHGLFERAGCGGIAVASPEWARRANEAGLGAAAHDADSAQREVIGDGDIALSGRGALDWLGVLLGDALLDAAHRTTMFAPALLQTGRPSPYGCGWFVDQVGVQRLRHHAGHYDGWTAMACLAPDAGAGVIAMCNLAPGNTRAMRLLAQQALEDFVPGTTPLALAPLADDDPDLTAAARTQLLRPGGALPDPACFAEELQRVAAHGSAVRNIINLWAGAAPERFELVERQPHATHLLRRYRLTYADRVEHLLVGTTPQRRIYWAWPI